MDIGLWTVDSKQCFSSLECLNVQLYIQPAGFGQFELGNFPVSSELEASCWEQLGVENCLILCSSKGGVKKTYIYPHFLDERLTPPPLIHVGGFYKNIMKFKYYPHRLTLPPPTLIHILNFYNIFFKLFTVGIFQFFVFCFW